MARSTDLRRAILDQASRGDAGPAPEPEPPAPRSGASPPPSRAGKASVTAYFAPCEPVCPAWATYHNEEGLNVQVYNRCIGTRFCANGCPYSVRHFNFWNPEWPGELENQLNPDVTVRTKGIIEKCTFCVQRINRARVDANRQGREVADGDVSPACVQACPTHAIVFGDLNDPFSHAADRAEDERSYILLEERGTEPGVVYLAKVDPFAHVEEDEHH